MTDLTVNDGWIPAGRIELIDDVLHPPSPELPDAAGLYRLEFKDSSLYFGETGDLRRRIGDYLLYYQATGIESEFRINKALHASGGADVSIVTGDAYSSRSQRCTIESRLIREAKRAHLKLRNGSSVPERIAFHASEIIRLSAKLAQEPEKTNE